jgi:hypothetical protein
MVHGISTDECRDCYRLRSVKCWVDRQSLTHSRESETARNGRRRRSSVEHASNCHCAATYGTVVVPDETSGGRRIVTGGGGGGGGGDQPTSQLLVRQRRRFPHIRRALAAAPYSTQYTLLVHADLPRSIVIHSISCYLCNCFLTIARPSL